MRRGPFLEQRQQLMLRPVETAHAAVGLHPHDEVQGDEAELRRSRMNGRQAPPVDEGAADAAVAKTRQNGRHPCFIEGEELGVGHFPDAMANSR